MRSKGLAAGGIEECSVAASEGCCGCGRAAGCGGGE